MKYDKKEMVGYLNVTCEAHYDYDTEKDLKMSMTSFIYKDTNIIGTLSEADIEMFEEDALYEIEMKIKQGKM